MAGERRQATILVSRLSLYDSMIEQALPEEIIRARPVLCAGYGWALCKAAN